MMVVQQAFYLGLGCRVAGVIIALFPSNYEIVGMDEMTLGDDEVDSDSTDSPGAESQGD